MRSFVLAASLLATFAAPAFAHTRHNPVMPKLAASFIDLAPTAPANFGGAFGARIDATSPNLTAHRCAWTATCDY